MLQRYHFWIYLGVHTWNSRDSAILLGWEYGRPSYVKWTTGPIWAPFSGFAERPTSTNSRKISQILRQTWSWRYPLVHGIYPHTEPPICCFFVFKQYSSRGIPQRLNWGYSVLDGFLRQQLWLRVGPVDGMSPKNGKGWFWNGKMESMPRKGEMIPHSIYSTLHYTTIWWMGCEQKLSELEDALGRKYPSCASCTWPGQQDFLTSTYSE
jgi:hypothetical protein